MTRTQIRMLSPQISVLIDTSKNVFMESTCVHCIDATTIKKPKNKNHINCVPVV